MAEFATDGMDELINAFMKREAQAEQAVNEMLEAEAELYKETQQQEITALGLVDTGGFRNSVTIGETQRDTTSAYKYITLEGRADHGSDWGGGHGGAKRKKGKRQAGNVRYATLGYIFEYGTSTIPARPWLTQANSRAESPAYEKARQIWEKYVEPNL